MENLKHTKGEWEVDGNGIFPKGLSSNIAIVQSRVTNEESEANAKLIAAAPELLEALMSTRMLNLHLYEEGTIGHRVYTEINNAINKATK